MTAAGNRAATFPTRDAEANVPASVSFKNAFATTTSALVSTVNAKRPKMTGQESVSRMWASVSLCDRSAVSARITIKVAASAATAPAAIAPATPKPANRIGTAKTGRPSP